MAIDYKTPVNFDQIGSIIEDYTAWFIRINAALLYPKEEKPDILDVPSSFANWVEDDAVKNSLNAALLQNIEQLHGEMLTVAARIFQHIQSKTKPVHSDYVEFKNLYEGFLGRLRRLEKDNAQEGSGVDDITGLRHFSAIKNDTKKELERVARQGNPFSLVMARIDRFAGQPDQDKAVGMSVATIRECMRPFDDAYYIGNGLFLISLKQADIIGAEAAVGRLQQSLSQDEDNTGKMTMSYCMIEPTPGDEVETVLQNMQQDLSDHINDEDAVLKFIEISPLERFVQSQEG